jgi:serine/threonine-protein kinase PknK
MAHTHAGDQVANRYILEARLGAGSQGSVWSVTDTRDGLRYALKFTQGSEAQREAKALFCVDHPSIPRALDFGAAGQGEWLVMQHIDAAPLSHTGSLGRVYRAALDVSSALVALHCAGIVHGDVKPTNILATDHHAWLVDLGLSANVVTQTVEASGTLRYLAPEVLAGERGPASDLFALGVTLVECLTGQHPFVRDVDNSAEILHVLVSRLEVFPDVIAALPEVSRGAILWLLEHDPERRPASASQWRARWARDVGLTSTHEEDDVGVVRGALVGRDAERAIGVRSLEAGFNGEALGVVLVGLPGAGRRRLAEEILRACRIAGAVRGACPDVRTEVPAEVERATVVTLFDVEEEQIVAAAEALRRVRCYGKQSAPIVLLATCSSAPVVTNLACVQLHPLTRVQVRELLGAIHGTSVQLSAVDAWIDASAALPGRIVSIAHAIGSTRVASATREALFSAASMLHRACLPADVSPIERTAALMLGLAGGSLSRHILLAALGTEHGGAVTSMLARGIARLRLNQVLLSTPLDLASMDSQQLQTAAISLYRTVTFAAPTEHALLARAALAAGLRADAWRHAERAASDVKISRSEALYVLELCADAAPDRSVHALRLARTLLLAGEAPRALEVLASVARDAESRILEVDALRRSGRWDAARTLARALTSDTDATVRAVGRLVLARDALDQGDLSHAQELSYDAAELPDALRARALEVSGLVCLARGDLDEAREAFERADGLALVRGDGVLRARARSLLGMLSQRCGDHDTARRCYRDAWSLAWESGDAHAAATYMANLGGAELECGALGEALRWLTRSTRSLAALGRMPELSRALANLASLEVWIGDKTNASDTAQRAKIAAETVGDSMAVGFVSMLQAELMDASQEAAKALEAAAVTLSRVGDNARAEEARARAASRLARASVLDDAHMRIEEGACGVISALVRVEVAIARKHGDIASLLAQARVAVAEEPTAEHSLWLLRLELACAVYMGDTSAAQQAARQWRGRVDVLAATLPPEFAVRFLAAHGDSTHQGAERGDNARWRRMVTITQRLNAEPRLRVLLELVMDATVELTGASRGFMLLRSEDGELRVRTARNMGQRDLEGDEMSLSRSAAEQAARSGEVVVTVDASTDGRFNTAASVASMHLRSILAVPLRVQNEVVGTLYVDDRFRVGAFDGEAIEVAQVFADTAAVAIHNARVRSELQRALRRAERLSEELERRVDAQRVELEAVRQTLATDGSRGSYEGIIGRGAAMTRLLGLVDRVAPTAMSVLLQGESGTGKELVARAIHANSPRVTRPFVAENCGAIPETLLESVLFGHVKGAFTGADRNRAGLFEVADGGTLFLDEVGEMSPAMQAKLLRVLQDGEVRPVGGERSRKVDVRVVTATHRNLAEMVKRGAFREDLFYRLAVMVLPVPPLRERREDIPALVAHMLQRHGHGSLQIDRKAMGRLVAGSWPGNVRQLENEVQRAAVLAEGMIREEDLNAATSGHQVGVSQSERADTVHDAVDLKHAVADLEREVVERALREHGWNQSRAAKTLGLSRFGLQKKLKRLGIPPRDPGSRLRLVK